MPALITDTGQHAATRGTVGRIGERLAGPGQRAGTLPALTAGGGQAIRDCGRGSAPCHGRGNLIAGNGKALTLLKPGEGPRG